MSAVIQAPPRAERVCRLVGWQPWPGTNSSLIGHATISFSGWVVHRVPVFRKADRTLSVGTPSAPEIDAEGRIKTRDGKRQYWPVITLENNESRERWQRSVLAALAAGGIGAGEVQP
jgi:hypothetical protein